MAEKWSTTNEISFIRRMGNFTKKTQGATLSPKEKKERKMRLLVNYIKAAAKREDWGKVDKGEALKAAAALLTATVAA